MEVANRSILCLRNRGINCSEIICILRKIHRLRKHPWISAQTMDDNGSIDCAGRSMDCADPQIAPNKYIVNCRRQRQRGMICILVSYAKSIDCANIHDSMDSCANYGSIDCASRSMDRADPQIAPNTDTE